MKHRSYENPRDWCARRCWKGHSGRKNFFRKGTIFKKNNNMRVLRRREVNGKWHWIGWRNACFLKNSQAEKYVACEKNDWNIYIPCIQCHNQENNTNKTKAWVWCVHNVEENQSIASPKFFLQGISRKFLRLMELNFNPSFLTLLISPRPIQ